MDYRNILATGFLLLCGAVFVQSLKSANAFPQGPNVSMGSNPIENFYGIANSTPINLDPTRDFVVTTLISDVGSCDPTLNGTKIWNLAGSSTDKNPFFYNINKFATSSFVQGNAKFLIPAGQPLILDSCYRFILSGYYTH
jgi:hypothetical protein